MPKEIKTPKALFGVEITEQNYLIGANVQKNPAKWTFDDQDEDCVGVITGFINGRELYGVTENYIKVRWSHGGMYNYPLNGTLLFSSGKVKKSAFTKFIEKHEEYDKFRIISINKQIIGDGYVEKGMIAQITYINGKRLRFQIVTNATGGTWNIELTSETFEHIKFRKIPKLKERAINEMKEFAKLIATPTKTEEHIFNEIKDIFQNPNQFLYYKDASLNAREITYINNLCDNLGISGETLIYIPTLFGKETALVKVSGYTYKINDSALRKYFRDNVDSQTLRTYSQWVELFHKIEKTTFFAKQLSDVVRTSNCAEKLKKYFLEGAKKLDENFIDFNRGSKKIVFTPKGKPVTLDRDGGYAGVRQEVSAHKFFGKYFKESGVSEYDVKCFADEIIASYGEYKMVEIEDGKIGEFYCNLRQDGWAVGSCMRDKPLKIFKLYDDNPHIFKMMAIMLNGELVGRALRVNAKLGKDDSDFTYMDRLYYKNEEVVAWFNAYCKANNIIRKNENSVGSYRTFYKDKVFTADIYVDITAHLGKQLYEVYDHTPYLDTLGCASMGYIYNYEVFPIKKDIHFGVRSSQHNLRIQNGHFTGKEYKGYCFASNAWTEYEVITITEGNYEGKTVRADYTKKTEKGYTIK